MGKDSHLRPYKQRLYPTANDLRVALLQRAETFCALTGTSLSAIGRTAVNDGSLLFEIQKGRNFTVGTYTTVMGWLDANWPQPSIQMPAKEVGTCDAAAVDN
jgi:hypothetical protein